VIYFVHHLLVDGWTTTLLSNELHALYRAICRGQDLSYEERRSFKEYIKWQRQQDLSEAEVFWKRRLNDFTVRDRIGLEEHHESSISDVKDYGDQHTRLSEASTHALQAFARHQHLTLNTIIQGALGLILSRYANEDDVVFGTNVSGRTAPVEGIEAMRGLLINTLPVRVQISDASMILPWLNQLQEQLLEMQQYEYAPLVLIQKWAGVSQGRALLHALLVYENYPRNSHVQNLDDNLTVEQVYTRYSTPYPFFILVFPDREFTIRIMYDRARLSDASITRMLGHFQVLLEGMIANPNQRLIDLPLLSSSERHQLLVEWNQTASDYPRDRCIHELFEDQVERTPEAVAVVFDDQRLTYRELNERANQLARRLQRLGVGPDTLVGICVGRSLDMVIGLLGILKAGGAYVPLDPEYPKERLAFMLENAGVPVLLTQAPVEALLPAHRSRIVRLDADWPAIAAESPDPVLSTVTAQHLVYVIYTSGSTGNPKGVQIPHRALVNFLNAMRQKPGLTARDILLAITTLSFDIAGLELWLPLTVGAQVVIASRQTARDGEALAQLLDRSGSTVMQATPSTWQMLLAAGWRGNPRLKALCGGEPWPRELARQLQERSDSLWNMYGPTETTIWSAASRTNPGEEVLIGGPIANTRFYVVDRHLQPVPVGVPGELCIGGDGLASGYLRRPELTADKFPSNPFSDEPGARIYRTGDLVRLRVDGKIQFLGRLDHQVKIRGFRIELGEIESVLSQHPAVATAVVVAREDVPGDKRLVAYVVGRNGTVTPSELRTLLVEKLPDYMIPAAFVMLDRLPLTPNGKVDRKALPRPDLQSEAAGFRPPASATEKALAKIWGEVLGLKQVGLHDNFFELGGHSLLAIGAASRASATFLVDLPLRTLFEHPTLASLAGQIDTLLWAREQNHKAAPGSTAVLVEGTI
jgi:amino acid adenylation domain-containing protein